MDKPLNTSGVESSIEEEYELHGVLERLIPRNPLQDLWTNVVIWISLAEALLPFSMCLLGLLQNLFDGQGLTSDSGPIVFILVGALALGYTIVLIFAFALAGFVAWFACFVAKTLSLDCENTLGGACVGGIVGLLNAIIFSLLFRPLLLLLAIATLLGQLGGAWGAWKNFEPVHKPNEAKSRGDSPFRFGIRQLMMMTLWIAAALSLLKISGLLTANYLSFFSLWILLQLTVLPTIYLADKAVRRKLVSESST